MAISGLSIGLATVGGIALVAGLSNRSPVDVIKEVLGQPTSDRKLGPDLSGVASGLSAKRATKPASGGSIGGAAAAPGGAAAGGLGAALIAEGRAQIGKRYVWATQGPDTFDCSGLVIWALKKSLPSPIAVPRFTTYSFGSWAKAQGWTAVKQQDFRAGDVIIRTGHMGIATSNTHMVNAANPMEGVVEQQIWAPRTAWWGWRPPGGS